MAPERVGFFHEDDFCQVELLPLAARAFCEGQLGLIGGEAAEHAAPGGGFTDLYVRPPSPQPLASLGLAVADLGAALEPHLSPLGAVETGYGTYRERLPSARAWGGDEGGFTLFADGAGGVVEHAWVTYSGLGPSSAERVARALAAVPRGGELMLVDWSWGTLVPLADAEAVRAYLGERAADE